MKHFIVAAFVAGLLLFVWQFLSWSVLNLHQSQAQYSPNQQKVLDCLSANLDPGDYFMPTHKPGTSDEEIEKLMQSTIGKPWARVSYRASFDMNMGPNMLRGWAANFVVALLFCWLISKFSEANFKTILLASLAIGLMGYIINTYINSIWFETNSIPDLIDALVQWGLVGLWLGWWYNRKKQSIA